MKIAIKHEILNETNIEEILKEFAAVKNRKVLFF